VMVPIAKRILAEFKDKMIDEASQKIFAGVEALNESNWKNLDEYADSDDEDYESDENQG